MTDLEAITPEDVARILTGPADEAAVFMHELAEAGVAEAQALYGQMLLDGHGLPRDETAALHWFHEAAKRGHTMALNMIGRCYENGWGAGANPTVAVHWYRRATKAGLDWGMYNLASLIMLGKGAPVDRAEALALFQRAAALGHAKSINILGGFYEDGMEVPKDIAIARDHYLRAAEGGDFRGQFNHARFLGYDGRVDEAVQWLRTARTTATPAFVVKMAGWLKGSPIPAFQALAEEFAANAQPLSELSSRTRP